MSIRALRAEDKKPIHDLLLATEVFTAEEVGIALELMEIYLEDPNQKDYEIFASADDAGAVDGYVCIGPTPATDGTYDLYWIAVAPERHRRGVGSELLTFVEEHLRGKGGRLLIAETSSLPQYEKTRTFYERKGFVRAGHVRDYYRPGDDLIIYGKYL